MPSPRDSRIFCAEHLRNALDPARLSTTVDRAVTDLAEHIDKFEALAISGLSGTLVGPIVARIMNKTLIVVRKEDESSHSSMLVEGHLTAKKYIVFDDFVSTGSTFKRIVRAIGNLKRVCSPNDEEAIWQAPPICVGLYCYKEPSSDIGFVRDFGPTALTKFRTEGLHVGEP